MLITEKFLKEQSACMNGMKWFKRYDGDCEIISLLHALIADNKHDYANWLIVRCMSKKQYVSYAIFAAEQVLDIYERQYPDDKRPRAAIEKAREYLQLKTQDAAAYAAYAATAATAAYAAYAAAYAVANAAADAAYAAAYAAYAATAATAAAYAANAAYAAADAAADAAAYAANAAADDRKAIRERVLRYGIELLKEGE